ncbi:MAG: protein-L-isoaspartate(D-aspartate) O-methyltransferase [Betaproteobacteria bacterium]|jgi:protein-L-isoaspartate(D-aspartate) O-methyltransferase|nr:protein-L-isoaspartate(D-aspartate) O-methyltransferase [Betaproteobacteria bacterium]
MKSARAPGIGMTSQRTRERMVQRLRERGIADERVLSAMAAVPRHVFVEEALASRAYEDSALPIGFGQTISQPYVVAKVIEILLQKKNPRKVLEIGTGCGYQAAVLAHVFEEVYSVERLKALLERARANLIGLRLANLRLAYADGGDGLPAAAPFDAIVAAAAARQIPEALRAQLAPGGRMILPLHGANGGQRLVLIERTGRAFRESELDAVHFVPFEAGKA